jgi:SAM-dependent methyltransferase
MTSNMLKPKGKSLLSFRIRYAARYLVRSIAGLAHDFWKDGGHDKPEKRPAGHPGRAAQAAHPSEAGAVPHAHPLVDPRQMVVNADGLWQARAGEISEHMWGQGNVTPGDDQITEKMIRPLGLTREMSVLDLSAGLGGRIRKTADEYGVYLVGMEPDPGVAARAHEISVATGLSRKAAIAPYDPMNLSVSHAHDAVLMRETIYRVADKEKFVKSIVTACKPKAQISFTDYVINPECRESPAIVAWRAMEPGADPISLVEMAELWARAGMSLRVHDDLTDFYKKEVMAGMGRFAKFMASGVRPDAVTKKAIDKRITTWAHRVAAIDAGMKFYRFYGSR